MERVQGQITQSIQKNNQNSKTGALRAAMEKAQQGGET